MAEDSKFCSRFTPLKWERLQYLLTVHARMCRAIIDRHGFVTYVYLDLYAGPGFYRDKHDRALAGRVGSPIIALRILAAELERSVPILVEPKHHFDLQFSIEELGLGPATILPMDCSEAARQLALGYYDESIGRERPMGLCFVDPTGYPDWHAVQGLARHQKFLKLDFLINLNATVHKRCLKSPLDDETMRPMEHLASLGKRNIYLWAPHYSDPHQFTLAYCTDGPFPAFPGHGFYALDSDKGRRLARLVDYSNAERADMLPTPGFLPGFGDVL